ncbi:MAG: anthranilate synthase component I family protein [Acidobacteriota bacterium]|nr:anthranilate synthase component I family protein [Acidobacteriota bacterium]
MSSVVNSSSSELQPATFADFERETGRGNVVAVVRTLSQGSTTPVDAFEKVVGCARFAFLFESAEGGEGVGEYSFIGADPYMIVRGRGDHTIIERDGQFETRPESAMEFLKRHFRERKLARRDDIGPLAGGFVGYLGYGAAKWFEPALKTADASGSDSESASDDALLMFFRTVVVFEREQRTLRIVSVVFADEAESSQSRLKELYDKAVSETEGIEKLLKAPVQLSRPAAPEKPRVSAHGPAAIHSNWAREDFEDAVRRVKDRIFAGDCYQVVLSQRFTKDVTAEPVSIYRALRHSNPSPYMYFLKMGDDSIIGASPEMLVRCRGEQLDYRPIAGTRKRGTTDAEDQALAEEMRADEKEVAEHMMLVDLGRNDLGRVARYGSVRVQDLMSIERFSKVQHLVSSLRARLRDGCNRFDALAACFPAGTVTGAPKVKAMEIIRELEPDARGVYSGAVLYADYADNLDSCIAIRTIVLTKEQASVQAGAGIVADSVPEREFEETVHKAGALFRAIELAENKLAAD